MKSIHLDRRRRPGETETMRRFRVMQEISASTELEARSSVYPPEMPSQHAPSCIWNECPGCESENARLSRIVGVRVVQ